ncbi:polycystic kidney disease 2-like 1 [Brachionus plicatilis]|uniref:Polycystic kidney disease 2-like 1 n=1 Tax=Brachionus plicatilis TaxID=10195 RepID=A0A3M7T7I0_BRAPC|nr:polycystic kidney disease 2-like 1 [Brachionus plicatilis]
MSHSQFDESGTMQDMYTNSGFIKEEEPVAMESEVYINGKVQASSKKQKKQKKKKNDEQNYFSVCCGFMRKLWATRQTEDIDKIKHPNRYVKITLRELIIYLIFLIVICIVSFGMIPSTTFTFNNVLVDSFIKSKAEGSDISFADVVHMNEIWTILQGPFLDNYFNDFKKSSNDSDDLTKFIANENRILGLARLRQVRVRNDSCVIPDDFKQEIRFCYSDWAPSVEEKEPFGPFVGQNMTSNVSAWFYQTEKELKGSGHQGLMNFYDGSGYVMELSQEREETQARIQYLFDNLWIDRATRAVFIDFTVYNANINLFCQIKLVFELPATGGVVPSYIMRPVKLIRYVTTFDFFILVCEIILCIFVLYYMIEEAIEIKKHRLSYFKAFWNILDVVILAIAVVCIVFNIYRQEKVGRMLETLLENDNQFIDFDLLAYWQELFNSAVGFMAFLAWVKVFKYVSFNKTMTQLSLTLSRCAKDVVGFAIMFFIVFLAYAQLGYLIFGTQVQDFSTFSYAIFTLFRIILGDFDFESLEAANRVLGPIFFLTYVFFVFFVLLNMFIAIINDTYGEIKSEIANQKSDIELGSFFKLGYNRVLDKLNIRRAQIIDIQKAITTADLNQDNIIDFIEFRNNLRTKGYGDVEIETLFSKYDVDGDRCLNEIEQKNMFKDLSEQNDELKEAYMVLEQASESKGMEEKKRKRTEGVLFEDYSNLSGRIDKMETSIGSIVSKVDSVLTKLENAEKTKRTQTGMGLESRSKSTVSRRIDGLDSSTQSNC